MAETTYPASFHAGDAGFLRWETVTPPRRDLLAKGFAGPMKNRFAVKTDMAIQEAALSFYPGLTLVALSLPGASQDRFCLARADGGPLEGGMLTGNNEPIYRFNEEIGINLAEAAQRDYIRFFFHFVRGVMGSFQVVETLEDIPWQPDADPAIKAEAADLLMPVIHRGLHPSGLFYNTATVLFKNALFKTDVLIASRALESVFYGPDDEELSDFALGQVALASEILLLEKLPLLTGS